MSQTDVTVNTERAKFQVQLTSVEPDKVQPPKEKLLEEFEKFRGSSKNSTDSNLLAPRKHNIRRRSTKRKVEKVIVPIVHKS